MPCVKKVHIYDHLEIFNFPKKLAQNKFICVGSQSISSLLDISYPLHFWKSFGNTA